LWSGELGFGVRDAEAGQANPGANPGANQGDGGVDQP
jgi:hypothetical protein